MGSTRSLRGVFLPLALAQFICSFAGSNMNVMINDISTDLNTSVQGVQVAITSRGSAGSAYTPFALEIGRDHLVDLHAVACGKVH